MGNEEYQDKKQELSEEHLNGISTMLARGYDWGSRGVCGLDKPEHEMGEDKHENTSDDSTRKSLRLNISDNSFFDPVTGFF